MGPLVPLVGRITGIIYHKTLANHTIFTVKFHTKKIKKFFFQEDNTPVHTTRIAHSFLEFLNIEVLF